MGTKFICYFDFYNGKWGKELHTVETLLGLYVFKDGFWVNDKAELTMGSDAKIWIPPSKIYFVRKELL